MATVLVDFGRTGLRVSRLCFGTGSHGFPSAQSHMEPEALADLLVLAWQHGISFWDTALRYGTHPHVRRALQRVPRGEVVVTSKTHAATARDAEAAVERCLGELETPYVDVLLLHEVDSLDEWVARQGALEALHRARRQGLVRAVGLSTHSIDLLEAVAGHPAVEVLFTNVNRAGIHMDADLKHYVAALRRACAAGQGVYVHKTLGEGALGQEAEAAIRHNLALDCVHSVCVGITSRNELEGVARSAGAAASR